jgi:hypothetical protein
VADDGDDGELERLHQYFLNPSSKTTPVRRIRSNRPDFAGAKFAIELTRMVVLPSGGLQLTLVVPFEDKAEAFKLSDTPGMLLEASVKAVKRRIK